MVIIMKKVLIFQGGWDGHEPKLTSKRFASMVESEGYTAEIYDTLDCLADADKLCEYSLIVACWTMGDIKERICRQHFARGSEKGTGLAGCHGGMCDAFRQNTEWQFMTGGQWVSHPGGDGIEYTVNVIHGSSPITEGVEDFPSQERALLPARRPSDRGAGDDPLPLVNYYHSSNKIVDMPVVWTKFWGNGRVLLHLARTS